MANARFRKINEDDLETIMRWRMSPNITQFMVTDPKLTIESQRKWFRKINAEEDTFYWVMEVDAKPVGLVSLVEWDKHNSIIHSGAYIAEQDGRTLQNIVDMNMNLIGYAMDSLKVNKFAIEILSNNKSQVQWMKRLGFVEEGILRQAILKGNEYYDMHLLSVLSSEWEIMKRKVRFNRYLIEE